MTADKDTKSCRLAVKISPNAGRSEATGLREGVLLLKIAAPPEKGKANKEIIDFLSRQLGVRKSAILIIRGQTSRNKIITIEGITSEEATRKLLP